MSPAQREFLPAVAGGPWPGEGLTFILSYEDVWLAVLLDHPGRVTLKTEELFFFVCFFVFHHRMQGREGDP